MCVTFHSHTHTHLGEICSICSKIFKNKRAVTTHKATVHSEKKHACNVCDKKFKKKDQLNTHLSTHQDPIDICYQCGITFTHKTNLAKHRKTYHLPQNHKCKSCSQSFIDKTAFEKHFYECNSLQVTQEQYSCNHIR